MNQSRHTTQESWTNRRVLVTGASGIVGSSLVRMLIDAGAEVVCFLRDADPATALAHDGMLERAAVATGRLEEFGHVRAAVLEREVDSVFHLGAQPIVGVAQRDPIGTFESNIRGTWHVLEACRMAGPIITRIVVASSDKAYRDFGDHPVMEDESLGAPHPYDVSKSCTDLLAQSYAATYGLPIAIARCGNIFGPGDLNWSRLVPSVIRAALRGESPVLRSDGSPVREYVYVEDAARGYIQLGEWLERAQPSPSEPRAFNLSTGVAKTVLQMTRMVLQAADRADLEPTILCDAPGERSVQRLDCSRARAELGWSPTTDLALPLRVTVEWYRRFLRDRDGHLAFPRLSAERDSRPGASVRASA